MNFQDIYSKMLYWDVYISALIHGHESLMLTVLLFIPSLIFSPKTIAIPIFFITYTYGIYYGVRYVITICICLLITTYIKAILQRPRPKPRPQLTLKPMYFRNKETNYSMPSGDCTQAAVFVFFFLNAYSGGDLIVILIAILMLMNVMLGRVYFCCHYIGDCQVGFGIGITSAFFINLGMQTMGF